jgi:hypothetical protein
MEPESISHSRTGFTRGRVACGMVSFNCRDSITGPVMVSMPVVRRVVRRMRGGVLVKAK